MEDIKKDIWQQVAEKIGTETKQVSSALYKLVQSELVERISKGVYKKTEKSEGKG